VIDTSTKFSERIGSFSIRKVFSAVATYFSSYKIIRCDVVYITPGQTFFGVLKYAPFIFIARALKKKLSSMFMETTSGESMRNLPALEGR